MSETTPPICTVSAPHQGARRNAAKLAFEFGKEKEQGLFMPPVSSPLFWPIRACPLKAILKADRIRVQVLRNSSWPSLEEGQGFLGRRALQAHANVDLWRADDFETIGAGAIMQSAEAILEARMFVDAGEWDTLVVGRVRGLENCFEMLALAEPSA